MLPRPSNAIRPLILLPALALPQMAFADITAAELWADWQSAAEAQGASVTAENVSETSDGLTVSGLRSVYEDELANYVVTVPEVVMANQSNGTVTLRIPQGKQVEITETGDAPERMLIGLDSSQLTMTASGTSAETNYAWQAPEVTVTLLEADSSTAPGDLDFTFALSDLSGTLTGYDGEPDGPIEAFFKAAQSSWTIAMTDPEEGEMFETNARQQDIAISLNSVGLDAEGLPQEDGKIAFTFASATGSTSTSQGGEVVSEAQHGKADVAVNISATRAAYTASIDAMSLLLNDPELPVQPVALDLESLALDLDAPIADGESPQAFDLNLDLAGLSLSDDTWAGIDPQSALPRGPMALRVDLAGEALVGAAAKVPGLPAEATPGFAPTDLDVKDLQLQLGEAKAQATGSFTMPSPAEMASGNAATQPVGALDVILVGVPELLAQLGQSGLVPQQQLMGAQMMLGMFATPQEDGSLASRVETTPEGALFVNGNRLR
ncbi:MAG: DUF2125 domain-containing protein [Mangrovicoccus sp.]|nr:DUF2125 domain-containing protein [Mangrovicoccus sp.]